MPTALSSAPKRLSVLDGMRGLAIVLVILSHGWILWSSDWSDQHEAIRPLFRSGNFAVTIFLTVAGYLTFRSLSAHGLINMRLGVSTLRRVIRVAPTVLVAVPIVILASAFSDDATSSRVNWESYKHIATYTWNWHVQTNALEARWDLGHLWYLSVDMQAFVVMSVLLYFLRRRPIGLIAALCAMLLLLTWWRFHVSEIEPVILVLLRTTVRMDAFVVGLLLGAILAVVRRQDVPSRLPDVIAVMSCAALLPLLWYCSTDEAFLGWGVTLLELDLAVLIGAVALGARMLGWLTLAPLALLGRQSLPLYVWHYPVFAAVEVHTKSWSWPPRTVLALVITALVCAATHYLIERHVTRVLVHPAWARLAPEDRRASADPHQHELGADDLSLPTGEITQPSVGARIR